MDYIPLLFISTNMAMELLDPIIYHLVNIAMENHHAIENGKPR